MAMDSFTIEKEIRYIEVILKKVIDKATVLSIMRVPPRKCTKGNGGTISGMASEGSTTPTEIRRMKDFLAAG